MRNKEERLTSIDDLEFRNDVESDFGEFVFEQLEEEGEKVFDRGVLAELRCESRDLTSESSSNVLRTIGGEISDTRHETGKDDFSVDEFSETWKRMD